MKNRTAWKKAAPVAVLSVAGVAWVLAMSLAGRTLTPRDVVVTPLLSKDLPQAAGKEVSMVAVEYPAGWSDPVHTHHAQSIVYVLEGSVVMQVRGGEPVTLTQ